MLSIIIPTYNEKETICPLIESILKHSANLPSIEILIIDDSSPDGTAALVENKNYASVKVFSRKEKGLASAIAHGIQQARGEYLMWFDADLDMIPQYIPEMYSQCMQGYPAVIASRYINNGADNRRVYRKYSSFYLNKLAQLLLKTNCTDYTSGIILLKASVLKLFPFPQGYYGEYFIELVYLLKKHNITTQEIGYAIQDRTAGTSKASAHFLRFILLGFFYILRILKLWIRQ